MASINGIKYDKVVRDGNETSYQRNGQEVYVETHDVVTDAPRDPVEPIVPAPKSKAQRKRDAVAKAQNLQS